LAIVPAPIGPCSAHWSPIASSTDCGGRLLLVAANPDRHLAAGRAARAALTGNRACRGFSAKAAFDLAHHRDRIVDMSKKAVSGLCPR